MTEDFMARKVKQPVADKKKILRTTVVIIGLGLQDLLFGKNSINMVWIISLSIITIRQEDNLLCNPSVFFSKKKRFGGMRDSI